MEILEKRRTILEVGVSLEVAQRILDYYRNEHYPSIAESIREELEKIEKEEYVYEVDRQKVYQRTALLVSHGGQSYKAYLTRTAFKIVLLKERASPFILME